MRKFFAKKRKKSKKDTLFSRSLSLVSLAIFLPAFSAPILEENAENAFHSNWVSLFFADFFGISNPARYFSGAIFSSTFSAISIQRISIFGAFCEINLNILRIQTQSEKKKFSKLGSRCTILSTFWHLGPYPFLRTNAHALRRTKIYTLAPLKFAHLPAESDFPHCGAQTVTHLPH